MNHGERVSGRYKIIKKIGSGGMANVYLAEDLILEREVAVKMMSLDFQEDRNNLRRFQREALSTTELIHPNIVNIYDVGEGDRPYIVMEYVDGMDLKEFIQENHPIPYKKIIDIMSQILSAISYAHANGVIHRDIKPHNILINKEGTVKITDFGIAVALSQNSITQTNSILGSVQYISPEQARGNLVTKQSDIYSLGIVLYEMLTGTVPFEGESAVSVALKHFQSPIPSLRDFDSRMPQPLENVVLKATAKEPKNRYQSVDEMKADLETSLNSNRRDEPVFVPIDISEEDTLVMTQPLVDVEKTAPVAASVPTDKNTASETVQEEPKKKKKRRWWLLLIPILILSIFLIWLLNRPKQIDVPEELIGMTFEDAVELIEEHSLVLGETHEQPNEEFEAGTVFRTTPRTGQTVREGSEVDLYVSLGEEPFVIEDYEGQKYEEVRAELTELGFTVESQEDTHETIPSGDIIEQDIEAGEEVLISETTITFTVSSGRPFFSLLDLDGHTRQSVIDYAEGRGLDLTIEEASSDDVPVNQVISQDPAPKATMYSGDELTVVISTGPEEIERISFSREIQIPYKEKFAEPDENSPQNNGNGPNENANENANSNGESAETIRLPNEIEIFIDDLEHDIDENNPVYKFTITENSPFLINFVVEEGSSATYRVNRDGELLMQETVSP